MSEDPNLGREDEEVRDENLAQDVDSGASESEASDSADSVAPEAADSTPEADEAEALKVEQGEPDEGIDASEDVVAEAAEPSNGSKPVPGGPIEEIVEADEDEKKDWYILKVQVNRENSICDALKRRVKIEGLENYFGEILVPTEDVREFTKAGKPKIVKRKLYPGYIVVHMAINDDTWFAVRETPGIGDFTGAAGKPSPLEPKEIERILQKAKPEKEKEEQQEIKTAIRHRPGDRVRVKEGYFQNFEGDVETIDESNGRVTVMINIFGRPTPVELDHWHVEDV